jgi:hypothetical protein
MALVCAAFDGDHSAAGVESDAVLQRLLKYAAADAISAAASDNDDDKSTG